MCDNNMALDKITFENNIAYNSILCFLKFFEILNRNMKEKLMKFLLFKVLGMALVA